jgi:hypothetical protein
MNDRWREIGDPQTAFLQTEGELRLKTRPQRRNAILRPTRSESQSASEDLSSLSRPPMREAGHTSGIRETIQSP